MITSSSEGDILVWRAFHYRLLLEKEEVRSLLERGRPASREEMLLWQQLEEGRLARERLLIENMGLVYKLAHRYRGLGERAGLSLEDMSHHGAVGLLEALDTFDPRKGHRLSTWAFHRIRWRIQEAIGKGHRGELSLEEEIPETEDVVLGDTLAYQGPSPSEILEARLAAALAEEAVPGLLALMERGMSLREAAYYLGETPGSIKRKLVPGVIA